LARRNLLPKLDLMTAGVLSLLLLAAAPAPKLAEPTSLQTHLLDEVPPERPVRYLPAAIETGLILGGGALWYWAGDAKNSTWDMRFDWASWRRKLGVEEVRFDPDRFRTNGSAHPAAGLGYFQTARGHGMSFVGSFLWSLTASLIWEYFIEFNEAPSLNDMIMTPAGGAVLGESTYRVGRFFDAGRPNAVNRAGALLFSPFAVIDDLAVGRKSAGIGAYDAFGFTRNIHHRLSVTVDQLACFLESRRSDQTQVGLAAAIVSHRPYRRPGRAATVAGPGHWTDFHARVLATQQDGHQGVWLHSSTLLVGRYFRSYAEREDDAARRADRARGAGALLGLGSSFDYLTRDLDGWWDKLASTGLVGPMVELAAERGAMGVRLSLSSQYTFAMVQSLAFAVDGQSLGEVRVTGALRGQGYYYAHGVTSAGSLAVRLGPLELNVAATLGAFWAIQGRDRYQERVQAEPALSDLRSTGVASAGLRPFGGPVLLTGRVEHHERISHMDSATASSPETRAGVGAGMVF
jgi:hypothetical protein